MTETNSPSARPSATGLSPRSADILLSLVVAFLAPVFLSASNGDIALARLAAAETVNSYRASSQADLLAVAQIVAFGFATLGSLCLSMADDIPLTMVLRLRGNANALSRSAETLRRRLEQRPNVRQPQASAPPPAQMDHSSADDPPANLPIQPPVATPTAQPHQAQTTAPAVMAAPVSTPSASPANETNALWAAAITEAADQLAAELPHLSPAERRMAVIQAAALSDCASGLLPEASAQPLEPGQDNPEALHARPGSRPPLP